MRDIFRNLDWPQLMGFVYSIIAVLICITIHEIAHGFAAYRLGDTTARDSGRLSLNPFRHIDLFGFLMMVFFRFGWAKAVPVNVRYFKRPKLDMAITALAGPASNIVLAMLFTIIYYALLPSLAWSAFGQGVLTVIVYIAELSVALAIFNLIPIPPLDGSKALFALLPDHAYRLVLRYERYGIILLIIVLSTRIFDRSLIAARSAVLGVMQELARLVTNFNF